MGQLVAASLCRGAPTLLLPEGTATERRGYNTPVLRCSRLATCHAEVARRRVSRRSDAVAPDNTATQRRVYNNSGPLEAHRCAEALESTPAAATARLKIS
jgi:hypothetical protein